MEIFPVICCVQKNYEIHLKNSEKGGKETLHVWYITSKNYLFIAKTDVGITKHSSKLLYEYLCSLFLCHMSVVSLLITDGSVYQLPSVTGILVQITCWGAPCN
jgi:hypothetical protein